MKALFLIFPVVLLVVLLSTIIFRGCSGFVSFFDGDNKSKMISLTKNYYYNETDKGIWQKDDVTDSYKNIFNSSIDSLMWNNQVIMGYSNGQYFIVSVADESVKVFEKKASITDDFIGSFKNLDNIPPLSK